MRRFWWRLLDAKLMPDLMDLAASQARLLVLKQEEINRIHYDYSKAMVFIMEATLVALDDPAQAEIMREQCILALKDARDSVARYGEHV